VSATQSIPVVSLADFHKGTAAERERFVKTLGDALVDIGFFAVTNHGVDARLIERAYGVAQDFFELPDAVKRRYEDEVVKGQRGFISFGREHAKGSKAPDLKEFWHVGQESSPGHKMAGVYPPNIWPAEVPAFKETFAALFRQLESCAMALLQGCALYVGEQQDLFSGMAKDGNTVLRIIHYPPIAPDADPQSIRAAAHEDINFITLLCEATTGGLELLERNGRWRPIHALKGQIVVDAGDMLQNLTNGYLKSTTHRVVNPDNSRERRFSMPLFVHPRPEVSLEPLARCVEKTGGTKKFPAITAGEFLERRLREIGFGK
jgi:isopenicillin N synthase-like dioxygenase